MNLIRLSIERPVAVMSLVIMVVLMGVVSLTRIPIQLTPDVRNPVIVVSTTWPGAAPVEIEREVVNRQEEELNGIDGLIEISSSAQNGRGVITMEFQVSTDMSRALLLVANRLDRVKDYPAEVDQPVLRTSGSDDNPITWMILRRVKGNATPINTYLDFADDVIKDRLERVKGVSGVNIYGGSERELQVVIDPGKMARYRLTIGEVVDVLRSANASVSAGDLDEGKRRYVVRMEGDVDTPDKVRAVVLRSIRDPSGSGRVFRVTVGDIAVVRFGYKIPRHTIRMLGDGAIAINAVRETGANVIDVMDGIRKVVADLNRRTLPEAGLTLTQVYDETVYIKSAIQLVRQNIWVGGALAALILMLFLRSLGATLVVSMAIPVSIVGSFVAMTALGRSINVISLAGMAFAVGMVVDAAIVVLENIYRHRQMGDTRIQAALKGAQQVWGAILVSSLTTVMVFIPVLVMELEVGQLFRDIAVAISVAVLLSLIVSVTVIPALARHILSDKHVAGGEQARRIPVLDDAAASFVKFVTGFTRRAIRDRRLAISVVGGLTVAGGLATWALLPKLDYLPEGNRNLIFGVIQPPPGYNLETTTGIAKRMEDEIRPLWSSETGPESEPGKPPKIQRFFFVARSDRTFIGAASEEPGRVKELIPVLRGPAFREPGTFGFIGPRSLFGRNVTGSRAVELNIAGGRLEEILDIAVRAVGLLDGALPRADGTQVRPRPGLELGAPEVRVTPDRVKLADNGVSARDFGDTVDAYNDGLRVVEITVDGRRMDLTLLGLEQRASETQAINSLPVVTREGVIVPVSSLGRIEVTTGPTEIRHLERVRTVTLDIRPPETMPLEAAIDIIRDKVIEPLRQGGLAPGIRLRVGGTADKLTQTWNHMAWDLVLALVIVYLVMAILFESFVYPFVIMFSVPLATAGGVLGLAFLNVFTLQTLDMLTLLGFVILIGIVVNNAILIVHQTLVHFREEGLSIEDAIMEATRNRIRPIFMSTLTSVFGMLPLVLFPGAGSELYRGLGSVVIGGLTLSAVLTLAIIPPLLALVAAAHEGRRAAKAELAEAERKKAAE